MCLNGTCACGSFSDNLTTDFRGLFFKKETCEIQIILYVKLVGLKEITTVYTIIFYSCPLALQRLNILCRCKFHPTKYSLIVNTIFIT